MYFKYVIVTLISLILVGCYSRYAIETIDIEDYRYDEVNGFPEKLKGHYHTLFKSKKEQSGELVNEIGILKVEDKRIFKSYKFDGCTAVIDVINTKGPGKYFVEEVKADTCPSAWKKESRYLLEVWERSSAGAPQLIQITPNEPKLFWGFPESTISGLERSIAHTLRINDVARDGTDRAFNKNPKYCHHVGLRIKKNDVEYIRFAIDVEKVDVQECVYRTRSLTYAAEYYARFEIRDMLLASGGSQRDVDAARIHRETEARMFNEGLGIVVPGVISVGGKIWDKFLDYLQESFENADQYVLITAEGGCISCIAEDLDITNGPEEFYQIEDDATFGSISRLEGPVAGTYNWSLVVDERVCTGVLLLKESTRTVLLTVSRQCTVSISQE